MRSTKYFLIVFSLVLMMGFVSAATLNVCSDAAYTDIQSAINAASSGDTIQVCAGMYAGGVKINKAITLLGAQAGVDARSGRAGAQESIVSGGLYSFYVGAAGITIDGFTLRDTTGYGGLYVVNGNQGKVVNNIFTNNAWGDLGEIKADGLVVSYNFFQNSPTNSIYTDWLLTNSEISFNKFTGQTNAAILLTCVPGVSLHTNINVHDNLLEGTGLLLMSCTKDSVVQNNQLTNSYFNGIQLSGGNMGLTIKNNNINVCGTQGAYSGIRQANAFGIGVDSDITITGNSITGCPNGMKFGVAGIDGLANSPEIHNNNIYDNSDYGIWNLDSIALDATMNWWGDASGPSGGAADPITGRVAGGTGDKVSSNVEFDPWLCSAAPDGKPTVDGKCVPDCQPVIEGLQPGNAKLKAIDYACCVKGSTGNWLYMTTDSVPSTHGGYVSCVTMNAKIQGFAAKTSPKYNDIVNAASKSNINMPATSKSKLGPTGYTIGIAQNSASNDNNTNYSDFVSLVRLQSQMLAAIAILAIVAVIFVTYYIRKPY